MKTQRCFFCFSKKRRKKKTEWPLLAFSVFFNHPGGVHGVDGAEGGAVVAPDPVPRLKVLGLVQDEVLDQVPDQQAATEDASAQANRGFQPQTPELCRTIASEPLLRIGWFLRPFTYHGQMSPGLLIFIPLCPGTRCNSGKPRGMNRHRCFSSPQPSLRHLLP